ncbi:hypothetical protein CC85DRAFT_328235 [Cutaneotrichosporon oleaginosum]|uniref:Uncharacterized protein n=1 Tax=Cutaneotrichosporon oleaginosum TaxID=879819 RepID=A0A0J0XML5_9TREE|nr:uncharacterized protein CC85DRAFT_328235 [Cutaneotrichosporon oleaginosum]KLT42332.1 hypothetical protein CC85DRAFT_328235 [Cutaneotrichosporon oleaginosum]TXT04152.1 hypothetical protein COLE_07849 [Cutaneotrichosporon oleaginosum]
MSFPRHPTTPFPTANRRSYELRRTPSLRTLLSTARTHLLLTPFDPALLLAVLPHLPRSDKATLLRLNTAFYWLVSPVLHTHLILPRAPWPRLRPLVPAPREYEDWLTAHPPEAWVHTLDVHAHPSRRCMRAHAHETDTEYAPPTHNCPERIPFLPRIRTLRVHAPLHTDTGQRDIVPQCAALQNVRAPKLVLVGAPCSSPLTSLPYATLAAVDHYVLLLAPDDNVDPLAPVLLASAIASDIAHTTACSATLVLVPPVPWMEFRTPGGDSDVHQSWAGRMLAELAAHLAHLPLTVRIVNAGAVDHRTLGTDAWDPVRGQALLETHFRNALRAEGRSCCTVEFVDMPTYLLDAPADELGERLEEWRTSAGTGVGVGGGAGAPEVQAHPEAAAREFEPVAEDATACGTGAAHARKPDSVTADAVGPGVTDRVYGASGCAPRER